jgi:hypothetical protein
MRAVVVPGTYRGEAATAMLAHPSFWEYIFVLATKPREMTIAHPNVPNCSLKMKAKDLRLGFGSASGQL